MKTAVKRFLWVSDICTGFQGLGLSSTVFPIYNQGAGWRWNSWTLNVTHMGWWFVVERHPIEPFCWPSKTGFIRQKPPETEVRKEVPQEWKCSCMGALSRQVTVPILSACWAMWWSLSSLIEWNGSGKRPVTRAESLWQNCKVYTPFLTSPLARRLLICWKWEKQVCTMCMVLSACLY